MAGIDYVNIRQDIEDQLGGNSLDNQNERVNPFTGETIPNYGVQPKDSPLYKGPVNPLQVETMQDNPGLAMSTLELENQVTDEEVEEIEKELEEKDRQSGLSEFEIQQKKDLYEQQARDHAKWKVFTATDLETGKLLHPKEVLNIHNQIISERFSPENYDLTEEYEKQKKLEQLFLDIEQDTQDTDRNTAGKDNYKGSLVNVINSMNSRNRFDESYTEQNLRSDWDTFYTNDDRKELAIIQVGKSIYKGKELEEFESLSLEDQERMLANTYASSERYKKVNEKLKDFTKRFSLFDKSSEAENLVDDFKAQTDYALEKALHNNLYRSTPIEEDDSWMTSAVKTVNNKVDDFINVVGGLGVAGLGYATQIVGGLVGKADQYIQMQTGDGKYDTDFAQSVDSRVARLADEYIEKKSIDRERALYEAIESGKVTKEQLAEEWDNISRQYSSIFKMYEGTGLTEIKPTNTLNSVEDEKIHQLAKFYTRNALNNSFDAQMEVANYYKNTAHERQTWCDYLTNSVGGFFANFGACAFSFAGILNAAGRTLAPLPFYSNPVYGNENNGLIDYLVTSKTMQYATALQETGCWSPSEQKKYREAGLNNFQTFKSVEQENQFMSSADIPDLIAQYGFTAATTGASLIGSKAVRLVSNATRGRIAKQMLRAAMKLGLASEETTAMKVSTNEFITGAIARDLYYGNLIMAGMLGTGEGALEATSTYNTFMKEAQHNPRVMEAARRVQQIENASQEQLYQYMINSDFPVRFKREREYGEFKRYYTNQEYQQAREQLLNEAKQTLHDVTSKIEDDALDAACANFLANSFINGAINVTLKQSLLSRDMKEALRAHKNGKSMSSYIDIVEKEGKYMAVVKDRTPNPLGSSVWKSMFTDPKKTTKYLYDKAKTDGFNIGKEAVKTAWGEGKEEYYQGISDAVSRAAFQADMESYLDVVYDPEARRAFQSDLAALLSTGLNELGAQATNIENIREGVFGFFSTLIGGMSPVRVVASAAGNVYQTYKKRDYTQQLADQLKEATGIERNANLGFGSAVRDYGKAILGGAKDIWEGGLLNAYRENNEERETAQTLAENINTWLQDKDAQALLTHLGGAIGFQKLVYDSVQRGDEYGARNNKMGAAIESIGLLEALKDTPLYDAYIRTIGQMESIGINAEFDDDGNYVGNDQNILSAISNFKNQEGEASRNTLKSDQEILEKIRKNASEFMELRDNVLKTQTRIQKVFKSEKENNIDPLILNALTYYVISSEEAGNRYNSIKEQLTGAIIGIQRSNTQGEPNKKALSANAIGALIEYGSIQEIRKAIEEKRVERGKLKGEDLDYSDIRLITNERERRALENILAEIMSVTAEERKQSEQEDAQKVSIIGEGNEALDRKTEGLIDITQEDLINLAMQDIDILADIVSRRKRVDKNEAVVTNNKFRRAVDVFLESLSNQLKGNDILSEQYRTTSKEVSESFIDMLALRQKMNAYENYLANYIENPNWLSSQANTLRKNQRRETIRRLYKHLLNVEEGETAADVVKRVGEKINELKNQGKEEDASILQDLLREVSQYKNYVKTMKQVGTPTFLGEGAQLLQVMSVIETVALLKNTQDFNELAAVFEQNEILEIISRDNGKVFLNQLEIKGQKPLSLQDNNEEILQLINKAKYVIDRQQEKIKRQESGFKVKEEQEPVERKVEETEHTLQGTNGPQQSNQERQEQQSQESTPQEPEKAENPPLRAPDPPTLGVTTWGDLDEKSPEYKFLSQKKEAVEQALRDIGEPKNRHDAKNQSKLSMKVIRMDDGNFGLFLCYNMTPIGTINPNITPKVATAYQDAINTLTRLGIQYWNLSKVEINKTNDVTPISSRNEKESLKAIFEQQKASLGEFKGHSLQVVYNASTEGWYIQDGSTQYAIYPKVDPNTHMMYSLFDLVVYDGKTVGQVLSELDSFNPGSDSYNEKVAEIIQKLKQNSYFNELFDTWNTELSQRQDVSATTMYHRLIGDFLYLGKIKDPRSPVKVENGKLIVTQTESGARQGNTKTTEVLDIPTQNSQLGEANAIEMLRAIFQNRDIFANTPPQRSYHMLDTNPEKFANIMIGLTDMDFLYGNFPDSYTRRGTQISNPYYRNANRGFTTVTDRNASQMNPSPEGARASGGGRVDTQTGNILSGIVHNIETRANEFVKHATQRVQGLIQNLMDQTDSTEDPNKTGQTNYRKGNRDYARTTHVETAIIGGKAIKYENSGAVQNTPATALGNTFDPVVREAFMTFNALLETGGINDVDNPNFLDSLYDTIRQQDSFKTASSPEGRIPNVDRQDVKEVLKTLVAMHKFFKANNITIIPKGVRVYGEIPVKKDGIPYGVLPTAGTLDLLAYDNTKDKFYVIDIKTIRSTAANKEQALRALDAKKGDWQAQTSTYWELGCQSQTSFTQQQEMRGKFGGTFIFPIFLDYNNYELSDKEIQSDSMTIGEGENVLSSTPKTLNSFNRDGQIGSMSDFLYQVEPLESVEFDYGQLTADQRVLIKTTIPQQPQASYTPSTPPTAPADDEDNDPYDDYDNDDAFGIGDNSIHTQKQSRFIDFVNNRIAPISQYKVSFVSRLTGFIRSFKKRLDVEKAISRDLSVTFFNGDEDKMKEIAKVPMDSKNINTAVWNMINYYKAYVERRDSFRQRLIQRHIMAKALYDFLDGKFGEEELNDVIQQIGLQSSEITELVEYAMSENKEQTAKEIKKRLEASDILDDKAYETRLNEFEKQMDDMSTKLEFLQSANASQMILNRISSIKEAIVNGRVKEEPYSVNGSLDDILKGKRTSAGARVLLTELRRKSKSSYMKALTNAVLGIMDSNGIAAVINIVDNNQDTSIEGEAVGNMVYIHKTSLDSQEHFERVLLHEIMHVISKQNQEVKDKLEPLLNQVIQNIKKETGMTEQQVRESTYGLKNVDEFISEFFTNFAFQESLRDMAAKEEKYDSIFDKVLGSIKSAFKKNVSSYSAINRLMNQVLNTSNTASQKRTIVPTERYSYMAFENLTEAQHTYLEHLGFTREQYEMLSRKEKQHLLECCG